MLANIRTVLSILLVALYTLPLIAVQELAMRTGLMNDRRIPRLWHRLTLKVLRIRVAVHGAPSRERPLLIAANHVSWTDILVLGALDGVHFIAKAEMRSWPVLGTFARLQRSVFVERERRRASPGQAREIAARLADGDPMVLFAEGTTGDGNRLLAFNSTLFGAAQLALSTLEVERVTVQPVALAYLRKGGVLLGRRERAEIAWIGDMDLVPHLRSIINAGPIDVSVHYGAPIAYAGQGERKAVARRAESAVRGMLSAALHGRRDGDTPRT